MAPHVRLPARMSLRDRCSSALVLGLLAFAPSGCGSSAKGSTGTGGSATTTTTTTSSASTSSSTSGETSTFTACGTGCPLGDECSVSGCSDWADWPMPNPVSTGLPSPASYTSMTGYVVDDVTKLWWQQPLDAENLLLQSCASGCTQAAATAYCQYLSLAGYSDWRLPTRIELVSIVDSTVNDPAINATAFPDTPVATFWTSSPYVQTAGSGWNVSFADGLTNGNTVGTTSRVRCVR